MQSSGSTNSLYKSTSLQYIGSSETLKSNQSPRLSQNLVVNYNNITYMVDPFCLKDASLKFSQLTEQFLRNNYTFQDFSLEIAGNEFTNRNIDNFLKLCQNLPTDVQDSEMEEICKIAKLFQANQIYHIGLQFIRRYIDPNFYVPDDLYNEFNRETYLYINCDKSFNHHKSEFPNNIEKNSFQYKQTPIQSEGRVITNVKDDGITKYNNKEDYDDKSKKEKNQSEIVYNNDYNEIKNSENIFDKQKNQKNSIFRNQKSVIYQVRCEKHSLKLPKYLLCINGYIKYTAKQKENDVIIGEGSNVHINKHKSNHVGHIVQESNHRLNNIELKNHKPFVVKYVDSTQENHLSLEVTFVHDDKRETWTPKPPIFNTVENRFYLDLRGMWNHSSIKSKKNIILQNLSGDEALIVRKIDNNLYEIEASPIYDPLLIFSIGLSDIIGPYVDYFNEINDVL